MTASLTKTPRIAHHGRALLAALILVGCGGDGSAGPAGPGGTPELPPDAGAPPEITTLEVLSAGAVEPGDRVIVHYVVRAGSPLRRLRFFRTGAAVAADSIGARGLRQVDDTISFLVPATATLGSSVTLRMEAVDTLGRVGERTASPVTVEDRKPPTLMAVTGGIVGWGQPPLDTILRAQDQSLSLSLMASDNGSLRWVGYRLGGAAQIGDSITVSSGDMTLPKFTIAMQAGWVGDLPLTIFARDAAGNVSEVKGNVHVYPVVQARAHVVPFDGEVRQLLHDQRGQRLFVTRPDRAEVAVLSLPSLAWAAPIALPGTPARVALTADGDSLLVLLADRPTLAVVALTGPTPTVTTIDILPEATGGRGAGDVAAAANGIALVVLRPTAALDVGSAIVAVNLATGAQTIREQGGGVGLLSSMGASVDHSKIAMSFYPSCRRLYSAETDAISGCAPELGVYGAFTGDATGSTFLLAHQLLDAGLRLRRTFYVPRFMAGTSALSADGRTAYFATGYVEATGHGFAKVRTSDGAVLEQQILPIVPEAFELARDESRLFTQGRECYATGPNSFSCGPLRNLYVVDLP